MRTLFVFTSILLLMTSCSEKADPADLSSAETVTNALFQAMADGDCEKMRLLVVDFHPPEKFVPGRVRKSTRGYGAKTGTCNDYDDLCSKPGDVKILQDWAAKGWEIGRMKVNEDQTIVEVSVVVGGFDGQTCTVVVQDGLCYVSNLK